MATITPVTICNMALAELGAARITNFTDGSKNAGLCSTFYDIALEHALTMHPWNFAVTRVADVAERGTGPAWGFTKAYTYPTGALRVLAIAKDGIILDNEPWQTEIDTDTDERIIVCNVAAPIDIKFIKRITNSQIFSPMFVLAFSKTMKWFLARPVTGRQETKAEAAAELQEFMKQAKAGDGQEGTPQDYTPDDLERVR